MDSGSSSTSRLLVLGLTLALTATACRGGEAEPAAPDEVATTPDPTPSVPAATTCQPAARTSLSNGWAYLKFTDLFSSDFVFFVPPDWVDVPPGDGPSFGDAFHPASVGEAGVDSGAEVGAIVVTHPAGLPALALLPLEGVTSPLRVLYDRQEEHWRARVGDPVRTAMSGCLGGEPALGFEAELSEGGAMQAWVAVRGGTLYELILQSPDRAGVGILDEIMASWAWDAEAEAAVAAAEASVVDPEPEVAAACEPDRPTAASSGWSQLGSDHFGFSHPADWDDLSGVVRVPASGFLDEATYAETGLAPDARITYTLVRHPALFPNVSVFRFGPVTSPLGEIHRRLEDHLRGSDGVEGITSIARPACLDGAVGVGFDLLYAPGGDPDDVLFQQNWYVVHDDVLHQVQLLAEEASDLAILGEVLRTWEWSSAATAAPTDRPGGVSGGVFVEARTATGVDTSLDSPDPATFTSVFPPDTSTVHVVFRLDEGVTGRVTVAWVHGGEVVLESSTHYGSSTTWASFSIFYTGGTPLDPGEWSAELEMEETGDRVVVPFTIEGG